MATKNAAYDSPIYQVHALYGGEAGGAATTQYAKFAAFTAMAAYSIQLTCTVVGTAGISTWAALKINTGGTTTTALLSLSTGTVGVSYSVALSTSPGGLALAQGDIFAIVSGGDATAKLAVGYELGLNGLTGAVTV